MHLKVKYLFGFLILISLRSISQPCSEVKVHIDEFTKERIKEIDISLTKEFMMEEDVSINIKNSKDTYVANVNVYVRFDYAIMVTTKSRFFFKLQNDSVITIVPTEAVTGSIHTYENKTRSSFSANYSISKEQLNLLSTYELVKFRLEHTRGKIEFKVNKNNAQKLKDAVGCLLK
ncbi:MAG: hypothetical protein SFY32_06660 [Bacteroidota bacterium]|nr:hypothetical protein [Bacteroidota bacterium]